MAVKLSEATKTQIVNYLLTSTRTEVGLGDAIALLKTEKTFTGNPDETNLMVLKIAEYNSELHLVLADRQAFIAEHIAIKPPSAKQAKKAGELAKTLDKFIANGKVFNAVIKTATELVNIWAKSSPSV